MRGRLSECCSCPRIRNRVRYPAAAACPGGHAVNASLQARSRLSCLETVRENISDARTSRGSHSTETVRGNNFSTWIADGIAGVTGCRNAFSHRVPPRTYTGALRSRADARFVSSTRLPGASSEARGSRWLCSGGCRYRRGVRCGVGRLRLRSGGGCRVTLRRTVTRRG